MMTDFHFLRPAWFIVLVPALVLLWRVWRQQLRSRSWEAACDRELLPYLILGRSRRRQNWPFWMALVGLLLGVVALAGPVWKRQPVPLFRSDSALVLILDLSRSMNVADVKPSRLERARLKLEDILRERREGQTALVVFAHEAFVVTPLTDDVKTITALLASLEPELMPAQGSRPDLAIAEAISLLRQAGLQKGDLLLVTDEERPEEFLAAAREAREQGGKLGVLGVGTNEGAPIPLREGGFLKDVDGQMVLPRINGKGLAELAAAGGGVYQGMTVDDKDIQSLIGSFRQLPIDAEQTKDERYGDRWREDGVWLLLPLLFLAASAFRRGWLLVIVFCCLLPRPAAAFEWSDLWLRNDQQGATQYDAQNYEAAAERFDNSRWRAAALYRDGKFQEAADLLSGSGEVDDLYNRGNAFARQGKLTEALASYQEALKRNPEHDDALYNKRLVEDALQQQQSGHQGSGEGEQNRDGSDSQSKESSDPSDKSGQQENNDDGSASGRREDQSSQQESDQKGMTGGKQPQDETTGLTEEDMAGNGREGQAEGARITDEDSGQEQTSEELMAGSEALQDPEALEEDRAVQQWLKRIPDDPGGLLRRKFLYQSRQRQNQTEGERRW
ncbi:MAG: hypothetical protein C0616_10060 [Desulfuromonas sp.]|nr:MAG: hypothetical protein C0616_10060 [Desulfuromonas sp.]